MLLFQSLAKLCDVVKNDRGGKVRLERLLYSKAALGKTLNSFCAF